MEQWIAQQELNVYQRPKTSYESGETHEFGRGACPIAVRPDIARDGSVVRLTITSSGLSESELTVRDTMNVHLREREAVLIRPPQTERNDQRCMYLLISQHVLGRG